MNFQKDILRGLIYGNESELEKIKDVETGSGKWFDIHKLIFKFREKYYTIKYIIGFTDYPEGRNIDFVNGVAYDLIDIKGGKYDVDCEEVRPFVKTSIDYKPS